MRTVSAARVLRSHRIQRAAQLALQEHAKTARSQTAASREITAEVLIAFGEATEGEVRVASLARRLKQLKDMFSRFPKEWEQLKRMLGVKAKGTVGLLRELPKKIKGWVASGKQWLQKAGRTLVNKLPALQLYFDVGKKLPDINEWLVKSLDYMPGPLQSAVRGISSRAQNLAEWLDELLKLKKVLRPGGAVVSGGVFAYIWMNVKKLHYDMLETIQGFLGGFSFTELLEGLPEQAALFLLSSLFPGIPAEMVWGIAGAVTVVLQILWFMKQGYILYKPGRGLKIDWREIGVEPPERLPEAVPV